MKRLLTTALFIVMALLTTWAQKVNTIHSEGVFDKSSKISAEDNISQSATNVTDIRRREKMLNFVEHYRSFFDQKDLKSIQDIFSDDVLIITENEIKHNNSESPMLTKREYKEQNTVEYVKPIKEKFIEDLRRLFLRKQPAKIILSNIEVLRHPAKPNVYSVQFVQDLRSESTNGNEQSIMKGEMMMIWLFPENGGDPCILIRVLQPDMVEPSNKITLYDFHFD